VLDTHPEVNVARWLAQRAAAHPARLALAVEPGGGRVDYAGLAAGAWRAAAALRALGVRPGDRVALALRSEPLYLELYFAAAALGAVLVPLNTRLAAPELEFQLADCRPRVLLRDPGVALGERGLEGLASLTHDEFVARLPERATPPELAPGGERAQVILYTSGTTGRPKGAVLPHRKTLYNTLNAQRYLGLREGEVVVAPIPLFHSFGLKILSVPALFAGATLVLVDRFDARGLPQLVARWGAALLGAVPVMYRRMLEAGLEAPVLRGLRLAFSAGAPLDVDTIAAYAARGVALVQGYGQTETSILCCLDPAHALERAGSVGRPVDHCELRIADESGRALAPGRPGEIQVRGPIVMSGYWQRPEETAASRCDGWHRTGDLAVQDAEGFVTLVGRSRELYISGGENVYPAEVERVLEQHPAIAEAAVVGVPDARWGESGRAYLVARASAQAPPPGAEQLRAWARERLAAYKLPRDIVWVEELPRTASGKVQKHVLLERGRA
jgi:acyl-CoA synthetase (AMP-forming)/AMP-acid ligase II